MFIDLDWLRSRSDRSLEVAPEWTILIPFFNERRLLPATIASIARQSEKLRLVLIDNGSTDGSAHVARIACASFDIDPIIVTEPSPGKVAALSAGLRLVHTRFVATCDADTIYPPHYLAAAGRILRRAGHVAGGAYVVHRGSSKTHQRLKANKIAAAARLLPRQSHCGGAGQTFRTAALRAAGGFDPERWNYVLEDHEIIHRLLAHGTIGYSPDLWCMPSTRPRERESIRWTLVERIIYSIAAPIAGNWFFYRFLAARLRGRNLMSDRMRERAFHQLEGPPSAAPSQPIFAKPAPARVVLRRPGASSRPSDLIVVARGGETGRLRPASASDIARARGLRSRI